MENIYAPFCQNWQEGAFLYAEISGIEKMRCGSKRKQKNEMLFLTGYLISGAKYLRLVAKQTIIN